MHTFVRSGFSLALLASCATLTAAALASADNATTGEPTIYVGTQNQYYWAQIEVSADGSHRLVDRQIYNGRVPNDEEIHVTSRPLTIVEHQGMAKDRLIEVSAITSEALDRYLSDLDLPLEPAPLPRMEVDEVRTLLDNGPTANRIDITFMGDGYTADQKELFFADMKRLMEDTFFDTTFVSYLPMINIHAVFKASSEQGIGKNEKPKNTAYKMYRPGETMRALHVGDTKAAQASCNKAPGCDYGVVVANDPYYGGIAAKFSTTTSSKTSGHVVLRHELGHQIGSVGEEYDGGAYFGRNTSRKETKLEWSHFATDKGNVKAQPGKLRHLSWPWKNLKDRPTVIKFKSEAGYTVGNITFSASGLKKENSATMTLDGKELKFDNPGVDDRTFRILNIPEGFGAGNHEIVFKENDKDGNNFMSSIVVTEYKKGYKFDDNYYGAFPTFSRSGSVMGYRPTDNACLMRKMYSKNFCKACQENNWFQMLKKVSLIDSLKAEAAGKKVTLKVVTQAIGQMRKDNRKDPGTLKISWKQGKVAKPELDGKFAPELDACKAGGEWQATVEYVTPEIAYEKKHFYVVDEAKVNVAKQPGC